MGKGADLKPCGSLERGLILSLLAHMKEASWCLRKGIDTATWALWDRGRIPGFFALVRVARSRPLCRLGKGRIPGPLAPRMGGATLPATLQISLKTNICNPLISEGLQVGVAPPLGRAKGDQGGGVGGRPKEPWGRGDRRQKVSGGFMSAAFSPEPRASPCPSSAILASLACNKLRCNASWIESISCNMCSNKSRGSSNAYRCAIGRPLSFGIFDPFQAFRPWE